MADTTTVEPGAVCPKCGSSDTIGFRSYDTQQPGLRKRGEGRQCRDCSAWWRVGEWTEYPNTTRVKGHDHEG